MSKKWGEPKANNQGLVVCAGVFPAPDLLHILPRGRTAKVVKILWYNNTGAPITLILGTVDNVVPAAGWVPLLPTLVAINGVDGGMEEAYLPAVEFVNDRTAGAAGTTGAIWVQTSAVGLIIRLEVVEKGV